MKVNRSQAKLQQAQQKIQQSDLTGAQQILKGLLRKFPRDLNVVFLSGQLFGMLGDHAQAERVLSSVSHLRQLPAGLVFNLGLSQAQQGKLAEAVASYRKALTLDPSNIKYLANLCGGLAELGRYPDAHSWIERWLQVAPDSADALLQRAICYQAELQWDKAVTAYQHALEQGADRYQCCLNLSVVHRQRGDLLAAVRTAEQALEIKPRCAVAGYNLGSYHLALGNVAQAVSQWQALEPSAVSVHHLSVDSGLLYAMNLQPHYQPQVVFEKHQQWGVAQLSSGLSRQQRLARLSHSSKPLTVGFLSEGFHQHPIGIFMSALLEQVNSAEIGVVLVAQLEHPDQLSLQLQQHCAQWLDITAMTDDQASLAMTAAEIDILIDLDTHTSSRMSLVGRRHAPVQASYLGYANTSGLASIDFRITDAMVDPVGDADRFYTERLIRLDRPFFCYQPPAVNVMPSPRSSEDTGPLTFGSFNKAEKVNERVIALWSEVLHAVPDARLLLQMAILSQPSGQTWMLERFAKFGIGADRLRLYGWSSLEGYLDRHNEVDMILDTVPWNGHTNTCHALWMGVPTLTIKGDHFCGRFGALIMNAVGCDEFIVADEQTFVEQAKRLAADQPGLAALKAALRQRLLSSALCDGQDFARQIEAACYTMWAQMQAELTSS